MQMILKEKMYRRLRGSLTTWQFQIEFIISSLEMRTDLIVKEQSISF